LSIVVLTSRDEMGMETNLCGDRWGWNESSAGMGKDGSETGWGWVARI